MDALVVSGMGVVSAAGIGPQALLAALDEGRPSLAAVEESSRSDSAGSARCVARVGTINIHDWVPPLVARRMSPVSRFAVVAARTALADAGLSLVTGGDPSLAVVLATAFGPCSYTQRFLDQLFDEGAASASPALFTETVANAPAAQVAIHCRARGPNYTLGAGEAGALAAVARGAEQIARGRAVRALTGAVEEITPMAQAILERFHALASSDPGADEIARPFDRRRTGFLAAEGCGVLVLEPESVARERGARIRARIVGWGSAFDATASRAGWGTGWKPLSDGLQRCLHRAGCAPGDIDLIVSGASGSRDGDRLEALVLKHTWADEALPPGLAPKSVTGEYAGTFLIAAILSLGHAGGPTPWFTEVDPELGVVPHDGSPLSSTRRILVSSLSSGGTAEWLVLEKP